MSTILTLLYILRILTADPEDLDCRDAQTRAMYEQAGWEVCMLELDAQRRLCECSCPW